MAYCLELGKVRPSKKQRVRLAHAAHRCRGPLGVSSSGTSSTALPPVPRRQLSQEKSDTVENNRVVSIAMLSGLCLSEHLNHRSELSQLELV